MFQVTSAEQRPVKCRHLALLKKNFDPWRQAHKNDKVRLIFVVPPNRYKDFKPQAYVFPEVDATKETKGDGKSSKTGHEEAEASSAKRSKTVTVGSEKTDTAGSEKTVATGSRKTEAELIAEIDEWVEQWVLEVNVDPLLRTVDSRIEGGIKKSAVGFICGSTQFGQHSI